MSVSLTVALLGAESTGKTTLAHALVQALASEGRDVVLVSEYLREFCERAGRTPLAGEQPAIAQCQMQRIDAAAAAHAIVVADTTALMTAVYSEQLFGDAALTPDALMAQRRFGLTLLCGVDFPWHDDGSGMRDGPQARLAVDAALRALLLRAGIDFPVLMGPPALRLQTALAAVRRRLAPHGPEVSPERAAPRWRWVCERCGDAGCEAELHRLASR